MNWGVNSKKRAIGLAGVLAAVLFIGLGMLHHHFATTIDLERLAEFVRSETAAYANMVELDARSLAQHYPDWDPSMVTASHVYISENGTCSELAVLAAADKQSADSLQTALTRHCNALIERYEMENPEEAARAKSYMIRRTRNYIILTISDTNQTAQQAVVRYLKKTHYDVSE